MEIIRYEVFNVDLNATYTLYPLGDLHIGAAACDEEALKADIEKIRTDPRA